MSGCTAGRNAARRDTYHFIVTNRIHAEPMRNFNVDLLRMLFAIMIVYAHMGLTKLVPAITPGPLVVFFFILTGYFTMSSLDKRRDRGESIGTFLLSKLMSFMPYLIVAAVITFVLQTILQMDYYGYNLGESLISSLMTFFVDVSCLSMFGMPMMMGNVAVWYLSGMMVGLAVTYPFVMKYGHKFAKYAAPVIGLLCIAVCLRTTGTLFGPYTEIGGLIKGFLISVGSICLGYYAFECVSRIKAYDFTKLGKRLLSVVELGCYILSVVMMVTWVDVNTGHIAGHLPQGWWELGITVLLFIAVLLTLSAKTSIAVDVSERPGLKKLSSFLAVGSLVLYLSNYYQIYYVSKMMKDLPLEEKALYIAILVIVSFVIVYFGGKGLMKLGKWLKSRMVVIAEDTEAQSRGRPIRVGIRDPRDGVPHLMIRESIGAGPPQEGPAVMLRRRQRPIR